LTAAHVFFGTDGKEKTPGFKPEPKNFSFTLVTGRPKVVKGAVDTKGITTMEIHVAKNGIKIHPKYSSKLGHRVEFIRPKPNRADLTRNDIAILVLDRPVPAELGGVKIETYNINRGDIEKENDPSLRTPGDKQAVAPPALKPTANAVKVGFGFQGNGDGIPPVLFGATADGFKREMFNLVDSFGTPTFKGNELVGLQSFNVAKPAGTTFDLSKDPAIRNFPPPLNTIVYDFDAPTQAAPGNNSSDLLNTVNGMPGVPSFSVGTREGSASGGDSGGPTFQYKNGDPKMKFITGVTSSGSDGRSRYGTVGYDTQVQKYAPWIDEVVKDNPCEKVEKDEGDEPPEKTEHQGRIETTLQNGVAQTVFGVSTDVYLSGGPRNTKDVGLPDGTYYFQVTDRRSGSLLSTDIALCRQLLVSHGRVGGAAGPACKHPNGTPTAGTVPVQLFPFSPASNAQNEYTVWLIPQNSDTTVSGSDPTGLMFDASDARTADFTVQSVVPPPPPAGSCQASSSLTVLVAGTDVVGYVPKGNWSVTQATGVSVVNIEGTGITPTKISTPQVVNSCASNPLTGETVCTANNTDVYVLSGATLRRTLTSSGSGSIGFSGGSCTNCGITMDAIHNRAIIGLSVSNSPGFQILDLETSSFEPPFVSPAGHISEAPVFDPSRNLLLSATEFNDYELVNLADSGRPVFFENMGIASGGEFDSSAEECTTGIVLAPAEFSQPSAVFIADLTQATVTAGMPGAWTAPSQVQLLSESILSAGATGMAVAQGTHTGIVSGEFGGDAITAITLPSVSGSGTPAIADWVTCSIGNGFSNGFDPHTLTAYQSPNTGNAIAVLANGGATSLAIVDLTKILDPNLVPRTAGGHACASGTLPSTVVNVVGVP
jgi:hypothetical protein